MQPHTHTHTRSLLSFLPMTCFHEPAFLSFLPSFHPTLGLLPPLFQVRSLAHTAFQRLVVVYCCSKQDKSRPSPPQVGQALSACLLPPCTLRSTSMKPETHLSPLERFAFLLTTKHTRLERLRSTCLASAVQSTGFSNSHEIPGSSGLGLLTI